MPATMMMMRILSRTNTMNLHTEELNDWKSRFAIRREDVLSTSATK